MIRRVAPPLGRAGAPEREELRLCPWMEALPTWSSKTLGHVSVRLKKVRKRRLGSALLVKHLSLNFGSGHDLRVLRSSPPHWAPRSRESLVSLSLFLPPALVLSLSLK